VTIHDTVEHALATLFSGEDVQGVRQSLAVLTKIETVAALFEHKSRLPVSVLISKNEECLTPCL
jgi:hypothetical protein